MKRLLTEAVILIRVVLLMLSTKLGTLMLCGSLCLSEKWPYINNFSSMSLEKREKVLQKWFKNWIFTPVRIAFFILKTFCLFVFFCQVTSFTWKISLHFFVIFDIYIYMSTFFFFKKKKLVAIL